MGDSPSFPQPSSSTVTEILTPPLSKSSDSEPESTAQESISSVPLDQEEKYFDIKSLPPEIRVLLFCEYLLPQTCDAQCASALLGALCPERDLYFEALEVFFATREFRVSKGNKDMMLTTSPQVFGRITSLELEFSLEMKSTSWDYELITHLPPSTFRHFTNLTSIYITTKAATLHPIAEEQLTHLARDLILKIPRLSILNISLPMRAFNTATHNSIPLSHIFQPTETIMRATQTRHRFVAGRALKYKSVAVQWDAGPASYLTWTDATYFCSIPWDCIFEFSSCWWHFHHFKFLCRESLQFVGLNPRLLFAWCPVERCFCKRFKALKCLSARAPAPDEAWFVVTGPAMMSGLTEEEEKDEDGNTYKIPDDLRVLCRPGAST